MNKKYEFVDYKSPYCGNILSKIQHSDLPNCIVKCKRINDKKRLVIIAKQNISKNSEITAKFAISKRYSMSQVSLFFFFNVFPCYCALF